MHSTFMSFLSIQVIFELKTGTQQNINTFSKTQKQHTIATSAISSISSFTCASVRPASVTTYSIDVTAMRVGRALVHIYYKIHKKNLFTLRVRVSFLSIQLIIQLKTKTQQNIKTLNNNKKTQTTNHCNFCHLQYIQLYMCKCQTHECYYIQH